jgi:hypothetical protein
MEETYSSETPAGFQWTTRRYIPEYRILHNHRCENFKFYTVRYRVHKSKPLVPVLSGMNSVHTSITFLESPCLSYISIYVWVFLITFFLWVFAKTVYCFIFFTGCATYPPWRDHSDNNWRGVQVVKLFVMQFSPASYHFIPLDFKYSPQDPVLKYPCLYTSLNVRDQVSYPYKTIGKIIMFIF